MVTHFATSLKYTPASYHPMNKFIIQLLRWVNINSYAQLKTNNNNNPKSRSKQQKEMNAKELEPQFIKWKKANCHHILWSIYLMEPLPSYCSSMDSLSIAFISILACQNQAKERIFGSSILLLPFHFDLSHWIFP